MRITCPVHPHFGWRVPVWRRYRDGGERVVVELPGGYRQILPADWTDERPSLTCPRITKRLVLFDVRQLVIAAQMVAEKLRGAIAGPESGYVEAQRDDARGSDAALRTGDVRDRSTARPGAGTGAARRGPALDGRGCAKGRAQRRRKR